MQRAADTALLQEQSLDLFMAASEGQPELCREILDKVEPAHQAHVVNAGYPSSGQTALHVAAESGHAKTVALLCGIRRMNRCQPDTAQHWGGGRVLGPAANALQKADPLLNVVAERLEAARAVLGT